MNVSKRKPTKCVKQRQLLSNPFANRALWTSDKWKTNDSHLHHGRPSESQFFVRANFSLGSTPATSPNGRQVNMADAIMAVPAGRQFNFHPNGVRIIPAGGDIGTPDDRSEPNGSRCSLVTRAGGGWLSAECRVSNGGINYRVLWIRREYRLKSFCRIIVRKCTKCMFVVISQKTVTFHSV